MTLKEYKIQKALGLLSRSAQLELIRDDTTPIDVLQHIKEDNTSKLPLDGKLHINTVVQYMAGAAIGRRLIKGKDKS